MESVFFLYMVEVLVSIRDAAIFGLLSLILPIYYTSIIATDNINTQEERSKFKKICIRLLILDIVCGIVAIVIPSASFFANLG